MNRCFAAFLALLCASITVSSACLAQANDQARLLVAYDDLDLATPAGLKALDRRIALAANRVCPDVSGPSPGVEVDRECRSDALALARAQIPHAVARQQFGKSPAVATTGPSLVPHHP